jgi:tripartite-type tricarboxylate transporter receptor subunit TctC
MRAPSFRSSPRGAPHRACAMGIPLRGPNPWLQELDPRFRGGEREGRSFPTLGLAAGLLLACASAQAQDKVAAFYGGRTVSITIGYPPGGSYDAYSRLAAGHLGKYIPGHPGFIVQNKPGGIGVMRSFYETAPRDGATIGIFPETIGIVQLTQPQIGKWNVRDLSYIGSFANVNAVFMVRKGAPATTVEELRHTPINVGCNTPVGVSYINPAIMKKFGGLEFKIICGYPGTASLPIALARGEIDMVTGAWTAWKNRSEVASGEVKPIIQSGLARHKELPDVPLMQEVISDPTGKKVAEFMSAGSAIGRALITPPAVPAERVAALRDAFDQLVKDPEFVRQVAETGTELDPKSGLETQAISNAILATPPDVVRSAVAIGK